MTDKCERYDRLDYGGPYVSKGLRSAAHLHFWFTTTGSMPENILVIGGGCGYEVVFFKKCGYDVTNVDLTAPEIPMVKECTLEISAEKLPFEDYSFDWVFSCETIEHIPYNTSLKVLKEIKRVGRQFFITIADRDDPPFHTHCNLHPGEHWIGVMRDMGFKIKHAQIAPQYLIKVGQHLPRIEYKDGVLIRGFC